MASLLHYRFLPEEGGERIRVEIFEPTGKIILAPLFVRGEWHHLVGAREICSEETQEEFEERIERAVKWWIGDYHGLGALVNPELAKWESQPERRD